MKRTARNFYVLLSTLLCLFLTSKTFSQQTLTQINGWNAYVHLPASYSSNSTTTYPTIIFFPGIGEIGTNAGAVISNGPGAYISQGWNGNVVVDGNTVEFIVISLQPPAGYPSEYFINEKIQTIKSQYRVNPNKLYLTGLSHGGWCSTTFVTGDPYGGPYTYASQIAAVVEVEGVVPDDNAPYPNLFDNFALSGGRLLGFEQMYDNRGMPTRINRMNATKANSGIYVQTNFGGGGHCCWSSFYGGGGAQPTNFLLDGVNQNLYQWLARQSRGGSTNPPPPPPPANVPPVANAGTNKNITLPVNTTYLNGSGTDADGTVSGYSWTKISGPAAGTMTNGTSANATVTGLTQGTYTYQLTVTDNSGATATAQMQVVVNAAAANIPPTVNAGADQSITLPLAVITLSGTASDADGTISSYLWTKISGPAAGTIGTLNNPISLLTALIAGTYTYQLKVTDNSGATSTDDVVITVAPQTILPLPPPPSGSCNTAPGVKYYLSQTGPGEIYRPNGSAWKGGDTVVITGTSYSVIEFNNVGGDACRPLVIMPATTVSTPVFRFKGKAHHIKLWGGPTQYGIKVTNGTMAVTSCDHIEINNVEAYGGSTGVYCKQDVDYSDRSTWASSGYVMTKIVFRNMYIHDINGEGMYVGITQPSGLTVTSTYSGLDTTIIPIRLDSIEISNNLLERCAWDGIQLSNSRNGNKIFNNTVRNYGTINMSSQQAGIILGSNTNGDIYNNTITNGTGNGIEAFGYGVINIYNNTLNSCGIDGHTNPNGTSGQHSLYVSDFITTPEVNPKQTVNIYSNAVNNPPTAGGIFVAGYYFNSFPSNVYNNTLCITNPPADWLNRYVSLNVPGSTGTNNTLSCSGTTNQPPVANAGVDIVKVLPANSATVTGSGTDADGTIASYQWTKVSGPATGLIVTPTAASTIISGLVQGVYLFELKVTDNSGAIAKDTMQFTVNSATNATPTANAGGNQTITLPTSQITLVGSGTDSDGTIVSYLWSQIAGYGGTINSPSAATTTVSGLTEGTYQYQLKVTDNLGATATAVALITVLKAATTTTLKAIRVNIYGGTNPTTDAKWNNWNLTAGLTSSNFLYEDKSSSTVKATITGELLLVDNGSNYATGAVTTLPANLRYNSASTSYRTLMLKGLNNGIKYRLEFYGSRKNKGNQTKYTIGTLYDTVSTDNNLNDFALFTDIVPDNSGNITVVLDRIGGYNYIAGFSIIEQGAAVSVTGKGGAETVTTNSIIADEPVIAPLVAPAASVYPNPFSSSFKVQIADMAAGTYTLILSDVAGKTILAKKVVKSSGPVTENIQTNNLPGGSYILQVINTNGTKTAYKLVKN